MGDSEARPRNRLDWSWLGVVLRPFEASSIGPAWVGLWIAVAYLILHVAFDALFPIFCNAPPGGLPMWKSDLWWTDLVNATLIGYLPAAQAIARRGIARDLSELRPRLRVDEAEFWALRDAATGPGGPIARGLGLTGIAIGAWITFADPSMSRGATPSTNDPIFVWSLVRSMLFVWLVARFSVYDFNTTRSYIALGRDAVEVDLLDIRSLAPFARRGQRSALTWVLFSSIFSLFWIDGSAAQGNVPFLVMVLSMATFAFVGPLVALRQSIMVAKHTELDGLRDQIREARDRSDEALSSPQLANAVAYYQLIESAREWPVDAANLLKFIGYLFLGLGSWLGGAVVERILDSALRR